MKKRIGLFEGVVGVMILLSVAFYSIPADAATMDFNGELIEVEEKGGDVVLTNGVTMISEDFLKEKLYLDVAQDKNTLIMTNASEDFIIEGNIGDKILTFNGKEQAMSTPIVEQNGKYYVPLRPMLELFGKVDWEDANQLIKVRYDYNNQMNLKEVNVSDNPIKYNIPLNSGITPEREHMPIQVTDLGMLFEEYNEMGWLVKVKIGDKTLIEPEHEGYILRSKAYTVEEDYIYWIEYPSPVQESDSEQKWYLYIKERKGDTKPVCIDQQSFTDIREITQYAEYYLDYCDFKNGNIIWHSIDTNQQVCKVLLYQHDKNETTELDSYPLNMLLKKNVQVAIGERDAFWNIATHADMAYRYCTFKRIHLDTGEIEPFYNGYNFITPTIVGDYLVVRTMPEGGNFTIDEETNSYISGELWVYDLEKNKWKFKVTNDLPMIHEDSVILDSPAINEKQIVLYFDVYEPNAEMLVVDLEKEQIKTVVDENGIPLEFNSYDNTIQYIGSDGGMMMTFSTWLDDGSKSQMVCPIYFIE